MKKVLIDLYKVKDLYSGLGQFSLNYAYEILNQSPGEFEIIFLTPGKLEFEGYKNVNTVKANFQKRYLPIFSKSYDIWHSLNQFPSHLPNRKSKFILTVHDLNFLIEKNETKRIRYLKKLQKNFDRADYITAISEFTKKTIEDNVALNGKSIITIYNGIAIDSNAPGRKPAFSDGRKFFFSIGIFNGKKNFHTLLPVMNYFKDYQLIIAGNTDTAYGRQMHDQIIKMNLADRVFLPGKINEDEKIWLFRNSEAFLFPSKAEGFGMPVIEAMRFGKPVFLSRFTSLPEIGGDPAFYFDNFDEEYMASFIKSKLSYYNDNKSVLSDQIKKHSDKFTWQKSIASYLELYKEIANVS
jgi:glycosyltransferase involved in cell wall biosynthesis